MKDEREREIQKLIETIKGESKEEPIFNVVTFLVQTKVFNFLGMEFWHGDKEIFSLLKEEIELDFANKSIYLKSDIDFKYRDGRFISSSHDGVSSLFVSSEQYRTLHDHTVNAMGYQQKRFAEIKNEYAFSIDVKDKEAEIEEKKKKAMLERT